jgi:hypothetical protein
MPDKIISLERHCWVALISTVRYCHPCFHKQDINIYKQMFNRQAYLLEHTNIRVGGRDLPWGTNICNDTLSCIMYIIYNNSMFFSR